MEEFSVEAKEETMPARLQDDWEALTPAKVERLLRSSKGAVGYLVWIKFNYSREKILGIIEQLKRRRIRHVRVGVSWAEWYWEDARERILWYLEAFSKHFEVLPCFTFTPPVLSEGGAVNSPPKDLRLYGAFVKDAVTAIRERGIHLTHVEILNEWNLDTDWNPQFDPRYEKLAAMATFGASAARLLGLQVVFGGASKVNTQTLAQFRDFAGKGLIREFDRIGFHNLRGTWSDSVPPPTLMEQAMLLKRACRSRKPVWLTEYGFPVKATKLTGNRTVSGQTLKEIQVALFAYMVYSCKKGYIERGYWYTLFDEEHESLRKATTGWEDELQWYFGDTTESGKERLLAQLLKKGGPDQVLRYAVEHKLMPLVHQASLGRVLES